MDMRAWSASLAGVLVWVCVSVFAMDARALAQEEAPATRPVMIAAPRERLSLDRGWQFHLGDVPFPEIKGHSTSYNNAKAGRAWGAAAPDFDDSEWRTLDLPHDWAVEGPFDPEANISQGYRPRGFGWYRQYFKLDRADRGKHIEIQLDGVSTHCTVWVNGVLAHRNFCGYTSMYIDITPFAKYGDEPNVIAVRVDAEQQEGWWYEGAGIYRHTWLVKRSPVHVRTDGVHADPVRDAGGRWTVPVEVTLDSAARGSADVVVESVVVGPDGAEVARGNATTNVAALASAVVKYEIAVASPRLWSVDEPTLYEVRTTVREAGGAVLDTVTTRCGFRTIRFDAATGFYLNDKPLKLKGTCNHQDHAGIGVAVPDSMWEFRIARLKEMGSNAYRASHNPPAREFLEACDRMGMLVMNENRNFGTTPEHVRQLEWLVRRDRNSPSVILWSVFNEEPFQGSETGYEMVRRLSAVVKGLDVTRPVTAAQSGGLLNAANASQAADVVGFNYNHREYDRFHQANPNRPALSSEDTSAVMTRGEYVTDRKVPVLDSYDTQFQGWGRTHREGWKLIDQRPFLAGGFVWTGFDYRGEPQPLQWPATGSSFGIMDLCGFPKSAFYIHQARWTPEKPVLHVVPHWNWPGREGKPVKVMVISNAPEAVLLLNGREIARKPVDKHDMLTLDVPYEPGKLEAVAMRDGKEVARYAVETVGSPAKLRLTLYRGEIRAGGADAIPVTVEALDADGRHVATAKLPVRFEITGPAGIIGMGNGDPTCHLPEKGTDKGYEHRIFNGLAQVIVQSSGTEAGEIRLRATSEGLEPAEIVIRVAAGARVPEVSPTTPVTTLGRWRQSPAYAERPDPNVQLSSTDMNTWANVGISTGPVRDGRFVIYRTTFRPRAKAQREGGSLVFSRLGGKAEVWIDGKLAATKSDAAPDDLVISLAPGTGERTVSVLFDGEGDAKVGLGGSVRVE